MQFRTAQRSAHQRLRAVLMTLGLVLGSLTGLIVTSTPAAAADGNILPPFSIGENWSVCEGYNHGTHTGTSAYGLDLVKNGSGSCDNSSAGATVKAPIGGSVYYYQASYGNLCINIAGGRSYTLTHITSSITSGSVIAGQTVGSVGSAGMYNNNGVAHIHFQMWSAPGCYNGSVMPFDTADGARICGAPNMTSSGPSGGNGTWSGTSFTGQNCSVGSGSGSGSANSDVDGNGCADLAITTNEGAGFKAFSLLSTCNTFLSPQQWLNGAGYSWSGVTPLTGDVNGDKKADYVFLTNEGANGTKAYVALSTGSGFLAPQQWWNGVGVMYDGVKASLGDVDGNGCKDLVVTTNETAGSKAFSLLSTCNTFLSPQQWWNGTGYSWSGITPLVGDVDGNGCADLVITTNEGTNGTKAFSLLSTCNTFLAPQQWWNGVGVMYDGVKASLGDVDGNGCNDLTLTTSEATGFKVLSLLSTCNTFLAPQQWLDGAGYSWSGITPLVGDVNGDKKADYTFLTNEGANGTKAYVAQSSGSGFLSPQQWWNGVGVLYDGVKASLG